MFTETSNVVDWRDLQARVADLFREMEYDVGVEQQRRLANGSAANIDVVAEDSLASVAKTYFIECKHWDTPVDRQTVQSFKMDVYEAGANFGLFVSKRGYQKGASSAAMYSNVTLMNFEELQHVFGNEWYRKRIGAFVEEYQYLNSFYYSSLRSGGDEKDIFDGFLVSDYLRARAENLRLGLMGTLEICIKYRPKTYDEKCEVTQIISAFPDYELRSVRPVSVNFHDARSYLQALRPLCQQLRAAFDRFVEDINRVLFSLPPGGLERAFGGRIKVIR